MLPLVGFIGLGIMGRPMAKNPLKAGYPLLVPGRSPGPVWGHSVIVTVLEDLAVTEVRKRG